MDPAGESEPTPLQFVSCGSPLPGHEVRIVDGEGNLLEERVEGHLEFRGPSSMRGYYRNPEATRAVVHGEWIDTGDLAYQADGELFITGRAKDTILKAGRNIYPQEIEEAVGEVPGIRKGCVAAFGVEDEKTGTERLVVAAESREKSGDRQEEIQARAAERISMILGAPPDEVVLVPPGAIPKTSSGKVRRSSARELYLAHGFGIQRPAASSQVLRLFLKNLRYRALETIEKTRETLHSAYVYGVAGISLLAAYLSVLTASPGSETLRRSRIWARRFMRWAGYPIHVEGEEHLRRGGPFMIVSNHASYIDAVVLLASIPIGFVFVAKRELMRQPLLRTLLKKGGHLTVDRLSPERGLLEIEEMKKKLGEGISVLVFPEGTVTRATGVRPFTLGAFRVAAEAGVPVCPVSLRGTRRILRPEQWRPRRGEIDVRIGPPIQPRDKDWQEIIRLRDAAKEEIMLHCGERPLDLVLAGLPPES
jgi:1-acyl-sn-glycerol-3-phosphate acyltransferase